MDSYKKCLNTLRDLVRDEGIFASSRKGFDGRFHGLFGRDTCLSTLLILDAENISGERIFTQKAVQAAYQLASWQGLHDSPHQTGQERGKIPHEIRLEEEDYQHLISPSVPKKWYVDPDDHILKNWDSSDSTPLWIITMLRAVEEDLFLPDDSFEKHLRLALEWCISNLGNCTPLADFEHHYHREYGGLFNQSWKDSLRAYLLDDGTIAPHPIQDIWVNALFYHALQRASLYYTSSDESFSQQLSLHAKKLREVFRSPETGFCYFDKHGEISWGEARDGYQNLLRSVCIDSSLPLYGDSSQYESLYTQTEGEALLDRMMEPDMFDPHGGIRVYSSKTKCFDPLEYHRGPHSFWPFTNGLLISVYHQHGREKEASCLSQIILNQVASFGSCIELYVKHGDSFERYQEPDGHRSSSDQTWTAAAGYLAGNYLSSISSKY